MRDGDGGSGGGGGAWIIGIDLGTVNLGIAVYCVETHELRVRRVDVTGGGGGGSVTLPVLLARAHAALDLHALLPDPAPASVCVGIEQPYFTGGGGGGGGGSGGCDDGIDSHGAGGGGGGAGGCAARSGGGGGGAGGLSYGIFSLSSTVEATSCSYEGGAAGNAGPGGESAPSAPVAERDGTDGEAGTVGSLGEVFTCATASGC